MNFSTLDTTAFIGYFIIVAIVAVVVSSLVCISLFLLARWWVERKSYTGLSKGTTSEGRVIEPSLPVKAGSYFYMFFISALVLLVDSSFLRDRIRDKLQEAGYRVEVPVDPGRETHKCYSITSSSSPLPMWSRPIA